MFVRDRTAKRELKLLNVLLMVKSTLWKTLFGKEADKVGKKTRFIQVLRIRDVYPGSEFFHPGSRVKKILDPGSGAASKNLSIFNTKNCF